MFCLLAVDYSPYFPSLIVVARWAIGAKHRIRIAAIRLDCSDLDILLSIAS